MNDRLSKADWIAHGLRTLAESGPTALKVAVMAQALNVSRGSFYWHFADIADFKARLLDAWREGTEEIIRDLDARGGERDRLKGLMRQAFGRALPLDRAVRSWALEDEAVAVAVAAIDERRIARLAALLAEAGVAGERAQHRAAFLYWAYLGRELVMYPGRASIPDAALDDIVAMLEA